MGGGAQRGVVYKVGRWHIEVVRTQHGRTERVGVQSRSAWVDVKGRWHVHTMLGRACSGEGGGAQRGVAHKVGISWDTLMACTFMYIMSSVCHWAGQTSDACM